MRHISKEKRFLLVPLIIIGGAAIVAMFGWAVMLLWNAILVPAAGASVLTFWQGLGLLVLSRILVGGFGGGKGRRGGPWKGKWANMTPEERMQFRDEWKQRCGSGPYGDGNKDTVQE
jgi:Ca2+/H+ antiporter, TMEM165/GDT1 family